MHLGRAIGSRLALAAALAALPAWADHPGDVQQALEALRANNLAAVDKIFLKPANRDGADRLLCLYELGGFYHLGGDARRSAEFFNLADTVAKVYEGRAVVSAGASARGVGAVLLNDRLLRFEGYGYDKVMSRTLNALNYVLMGDLEAARVEVRKAEEYQKLERERHQKEVQKAGPRPPAGAEAARLDNPNVQAAYGPMFDQAKRVRNSFENAFTYYLSSQIYLAQGEDGLNDAMVEIRRAAELAPQCPAVADAFGEIARAHEGGTGTQADLAQTRTRLEEVRSELTGGPAAAGPPDPAPAEAPAGAGSVVVCFEAGLVPPLEEVKFSLPASGRTYPLAFPIYRDFGAAQPPLAVTPAVPARTFTTATILETRTLAVKSLQERMPGILTRGLLGAAAKGEMQKKAEKEWGLLGGLLSGLASVAATNADRRSWQSLPAEVQVARFQLPPGPNTLTVRGPGWTEPVPLSIAPGSQTFLVVRAFPGFRRIDVRTFGGAQGPAPAAGPPAPASAPAPAGPADPRPAAPLAGPVSL
jgi:uncharacterized protein